MEEIKHTEEEFDELDDGYTPLTQEQIDEMLENSVLRRYTEEELDEQPNYRDFLRESIIMFVEKWGKGEPVYESDLLNVLDALPSEWLANTYENRFKYYNYDRDRYYFAEQILLPYCIKKGILVKKKGAKDYEYVEEKHGQMPELDFEF